ncbi:MAG: dTDP-glucose 4,6-dehydratase [Deltaproteobacteria bacterium]|nr:dTDP-glucose 4,6-dehydratase [Deltaproteobacteria bacterium]
MTIMVVGGAGFIGSNFVLEWLSLGLEPVVNLDKLTYAGNRTNLSGLPPDRHLFVHGDKADRALTAELLAQRRPRAVVDFAAETHVDRSIRGPEAFLTTNVLGTFHLLEAVRAYWLGLAGAEREAFRFLQISTDEVYGSLGPDDPAFVEESPYAPNSPYAASKAAADHLTRAYGRTYGLPTLTTNCSNNYGPFQFPEKLVPLMILNGLAGRDLPIYGDGRQIRDWLHVADHCRALRLTLERGRPGETYNIGGGQEKTNLETVELLCRLLDELAPAADGRPRRDLMRRVADRPGHDRRYAVDFSKIARELGFAPARTFEQGLRETVEWYLGHRSWTDDVVSGAYRDWVKVHYGAASLEGGEKS